MAFFSLWEPAPTFAAAPTDGELAERIRLLCSYAVKNGPSFIDMMRQKQAGDPKFAFLAGGEGADFFRWQLYCSTYNLPPDAPLPQGAYPPHAAQAPPQQGVQPAYGAPQQLPPHVRVQSSPLISQVTPALKGVCETLGANSSRERDSRDVRDTAACLAAVAGMRP